MRFLTCLVRSLICVIALAGSLAPANAQPGEQSTQQSPVRITLDPNRTYQTFRAWEATANLNWPRDLDPYLDPIMDRLIRDIGITRVRVGVFCGAENTNRAFRQVADGSASYADFSKVRYITANDDADPFHINPDGFDFADLDWRVEQQLLPLMRQARAAGAPLAFTLNYVCFTDKLPSDGYIHTQPDEYAEFILAAFLHLRDRWALVPEALEVILEPDMVKEWTPDLMGRAMAAVGPRLRGAGFTPRLIAPSVTNAANFAPWVDGIAAVPGATDDLWELSYHRYRGGQSEVLQDIGTRGAAMGIPTGMLEFFNGKGTHDVLHSDLKLAQVSAWQGRAMMGLFRGDIAGLAALDDVRMNRQYTHYIRPGARRIGATTSDRTFDPLVFLGPGGAATVIVKADGAGEIIVDGLPPGAYHLSVATALGTTDNLTARTVSAGDPLTAAMPAGGVLTLSTIRP